MLGTPTTVKLAHFILLAYTDLFNRRGYDMVGTTDNPKQLIVHSYDFKNGDFSEKYKYTHTSPIHVVIPSNFDGSKEGSLLLVTKLSDGSFTNSVLFTKDNKIVELPKSTAIPILYTQSETLKPALILQTDRKLISIEFESDRNFKEKEMTGLLGEGEKIHKDHTSTFVNLKRDQKADLALIVARNNKKFLKVFGNSNEGFKLFFEMELPAVTGPLVFNDFSKHNMNDLAFISKENDEYYLNVFYNANSKKASTGYSYSANGLEYKENKFTEEIYRKGDPNIKQNLGHLSGLEDKISECKLSCEHLNNIPSGIFDTDIDLDGEIELFIIAKMNSKGDRIIPLRLDRGKQVYVVYQEMKFLYNESNVLSFSTVDYKNEGRELLVVNKVADSGASPEVLILPDIIKPENMKISVTTVKDDTKTFYGNGIVGTSYLLSYNEGNNISIGSSSPPGPFLHLKNQTFTFGLGSRTLHINSLRVTVPAYGDYETPYLIKYDIIQNFDLIVGAQKKGKYNIRAFIISSRYVYNILVTLTIVIVSNCIIVLILHYRHIQKIKEARSRDSMHPLFRSLG